MEVKTYGMELEVSLWNKRQLEIMLRKEHLEGYFKVVKDMSVIDNDETSIGCEMVLRNPMDESGFLKASGLLAAFVKKHNIKFNVSADERYTGSEKYRYNGSKYSSCSLHIHYGVSPELATTVTLSNLIKTVKDIEPTLIKLARRNNRIFSTAIRSEFSKLKHLTKPPRSTNAFLMATRYNGVNVTNLVSSCFHIPKKETVEFRYAHGSLILNRKDFLKYHRLCKKCVESCF